MAFDTICIIIAFHTLQTIGKLLRWATRIKYTSNVYPSPAVVIQLRKNRLKLTVCRMLKVHFKLLVWVREARGRLKTCNYHSENAQDRQSSCTCSFYSIAFASTTFPWKVIPK